MRLPVVGVLVALGVSAAQGHAQTPAPSTSELGIRGPAFFAVQVRDIERASSWYQVVFDLEVVRRLEAEDGAYAIRILSGSELTVELIEEHRSEAPPQRHFGHFKAGLYVVDIEAFHQRLLASGVDVDARIFVDPALGVRSFVFRDMEGNRIQALQPFTNMLHDRWERSTGPWLSDQAGVSGSDSASSARRRRPPSAWRSRTRAAKRRENMASRSAQ
jgi:predicted enzyme related to lactoylglutathione lyase